MPLLCLKCDSKVEASLVKPTYWCPGCNKEITKDETYKVGKRFFAVEPEELRREKARKKRGKLKGVKAKQRRHVRQKNLGMKEHRRTKQKGGKK